MEVKLVIVRLPNGSVEVSGPIGDKLLCYGLLEAAKDAIRHFVAENEQRIVPAVMVPTKLS